jgi:transcriptional regulator with XRE-family HTH domain
MGAFDNLGQALRWLRSRQHRKQYEIADAAGITKAMLSAYETGKQNPSIETLEKILEALHSDLSELHNALVLHQGGRPPEPGGVAADWGEPPLRGGGGRVSIYDVVDARGGMPASWERSLAQMLEGFHGLIRQMYQQLERSAQVQSFPGPRPAGGSEGEPGGGPRRIEDGGGSQAPGDDEEE